jgi:predicted porin
LLPNVLSFSGKTRQNDLDVNFTISIQPGGYTQHALSGGGSQENRQSFFSFGDASWGSIKLGKDLGIFASDAILNDITLLGVGGGAPGVGGTAGATTLGGIGAGYLYADWKEQVAYTTPNMNGFSATVGITQGYNVGYALGQLGGGTTSTGLSGSEPAFEGKASYDFSGDVLKGKVWVSGLSQKIKTIVAAGAADQRGTVGDIGVNVSAANFGVVAYYYSGSGVGTAGVMQNALSVTGATRDSDGGYIQATYVLPTATKLGLAYGVSNLDRAAGDAATFDYSNKRVTAGVYHPLTKHVNLVAEYNNVKTEVTGVTTTNNAVSLGGILFF